VRADKENPPCNDEAYAYLRFSVIDPDAAKVARFANTIVELALVSIPGFTATAPPGKGTPAIQHWPALVANAQVQPEVTIDGETIAIEPLAGTDPPPQAPVLQPPPKALEGETTEVAFGRLFGTRSGDKGGNANLGVWARSPAAFEFLRGFLSTARLRQLLPDLAPFEVERYELPNLQALNFYIRGILGEGVAASLRSDPQAKTLGEYLRARIIEVPADLARSA
jgi:hypothetical protein